MEKKNLQDIGKKFFMLTWDISQKLHRKHFYRIYGSRDVYKEIFFFFKNDHDVRWKQQRNAAGYEDAQSETRGRG